jgi:ATP-dependent Clp protease ATP-binding subunit ClpA
MTSNLGSEIIQEKTEYEEIKAEIDNMLFKYFKPEFLNRIDEIITFRPLSPDIIKEIAQIQISYLKKLLTANKISLNVGKAALEKIAELGYNPALGARPLKRVIQREIQDKLSTMILEGKLLAGSTVKLDYKADQFVFN